LVDRLSAVFSFDGEPIASKVTCNDCGEEHDFAAGFIRRDEGAISAYRANWYPHTEEAFLDVVLGYWEEPDYPNQFTFGAGSGESRVMKARCVRSWMAEPSPHPMSPSSGSDSRGSRPWTIRGWTSSGPSSTG
jgi:hypothetical protein